MNLKQLRAYLARKIKEDAGGNETAWAASNGLSQGYVTHVAKGMQTPGPKILSALGIRKVVNYEVVRK